MIISFRIFFKITVRIAYELTFYYIFKPNTTQKKKKYQHITKKKNNI